MVLANRSFLYALLVRAYAEEPDTTFAEVFADDHAHEEMSLAEAAEDPDWQRDIRDSRAFLENHLLMWIDLLAESIEGGYGNCFYARLTRLASLIAKRDLALPQEIL